MTKEALITDKVTLMETIMRALCDSPSRVRKANKERLTRKCKERLTSNEGLPVDTRTGIHKNVLVLELLFPIEDVKQYSDDGHTISESGR